MILYGWKPSSNSKFSIRAFRAYPLIEFRQTAPCRAIRASSISVNGNPLPLFKNPCLASGGRSAPEPPFSMLPVSDMFLYVSVCYYINMYMSINVCVYMSIYIYICRYIHVYVYRERETIYIYRERDIERERGREKERERKRERERDLLCVYIYIYMYTYIRVCY